jgi:hypothetical protein
VTRDSLDCETFGLLAAADPVAAGVARSAALTIADRATDAGDCHRLLDMCGLLETGQ